MPKKPKTRGHDKRAKLRKLLDAGVPMPEAGIQAGYSENYSRGELYRTIARDSKLFKAKEKPKSFRETVEKLGATIEKRAEKLIDLAFNATKQISAISTSDANGKTVDWIDVPDNQTQLGALKELMRGCGDTPTGTGTAIQINNITEHVRHTPEQVIQIAKDAQRLKDRG